MRRSLAMGSVETIAGFGGLVLTAGVLTLVAVGAVVVGVLGLVPNWALLPMLPIRPLLFGLAMWGKGLFHSFSFLGFFPFGSLLFASFFPPGFSPLIP